MKIALFAALLFATPAFAADRAFDLYVSGKYEEAMRAGDRANTAPGLAVAARAALADAALRDAPCMECLKRAEGYARRAVASDPRLTDGHTWLAASLGLQARITGPLIARLHDVPARIKSELDAALVDDLKNSFTLAGLGGWNMEIVHVGGASLAHWLYGATEKAGLDAFDRAVRAAPDNIAVHYQIALALASFDADAYRSRIGAELDAAARGTAGTAYERAIQARASELKTAMNGDRAAFDEKVRKYQGYP